MIDYSELEGVIPLPYEYDDQVDDIAEYTGLSKKDVRSFLQAQRKLAQSKLALGMEYTLRGVVKITPVVRGDGIALSSRVAQSVERPKTIRGVTEEVKVLEDEDLLDDLS